MNRAIIGGMSFAGSTAAWLVSLASSFGIKGKIAVDGGGKIDGDLHRSVVRHGGEFQFGHSAKFLSLILREHEIAVDEDPDREARPDGEGRLDIDLAADELLAGLIDRILASTLQGADEIALIAVRAKLRADAEQSRERRRLQKIAPMIIDAILEPGIAFRVGAGLVLKHDRLAVRKNDAVPDEQDARLAEGHLAVVAADQFGALRHKEKAACRAVVDIFRDLRGDQARQVGLDAGDQSRRYDRARLQDIG